MPILRAAGRMKFRCMFCRAKMDADAVRYKATVTYRAEPVERYACSIECVRLASEDKQVEHVQVKDLDGNWLEYETPRL